LHELGCHSRQTWDRVGDTTVDCEPTGGVEDQFINLQWLEGKGYGEEQVFSSDENVKAYLVVAHEVCLLLLIRVFFHNEVVFIDLLFDVSVAVFFPALLALLELSFLVLPRFLALLPKIHVAHVEFFTNHLLDLLFGLFRQTQTHFVETPADPVEGEVMCDDIRS